MIDPIQAPEGTPFDGESIADGALAMEMLEGGIDLDGVEYARIGDYLGPWAITEGALTNGVEFVGSIDLAEHVRGNQIRAAEREALAVHEGALARVGGRVIEGGIAVVPIRGTMMKAVSSFGEGTSTVRLRQALREAGRDPEVKGILLNIDSPGGTVAGTMELANEVRAVAREKPVVAFIEDMGASAAFWVASQADKIFTNAVGMVGSIGTFGVLVDQSARAAMAGVRVLVIRAGKFKGAGVPGTEITEEQQAEFQEKIRTLNEFFLAGVARGRGMTRAAVEAVADGRVFIGEEAVRMNLADGVRTFDQAIREVKTAARSRNAARAITQTEVEKMTEPTAATFEELKAGLPKADAGFIVSALEKGETVIQARERWIGLEQARVEQSRAELEAKTIGVEAIGSGSGSSAAGAGGDPIEEFTAAVQAKIDAGMPKARAITAVNHEDPELREAYVQAYTASVRKEKTRPGGLQVTAKA